MDRIIIKSLSQSGFSLLETLVAVSILGLLLTGSAALVQQALKVSSKLKNDTTALYLAQEGLELVRYQRDTNRLSNPLPNAWINGITGSAQPCHNKPCISQINPSTGALVFLACNPPCQAPGGDSYLRFNTVSKLYAHQTGLNWVITPYRRLIEVECSDGPSCGSDEIRVRVTVNWNTVFGARSYVVEENLFNWQ